MFVRFKVLTAVNLSMLVFGFLTPSTSPRGFRTQINIIIYGSKPWQTVYNTSGFPIAYLFQT
jgi:hypothetical protein